MKKIIAMILMSMLVLAGCQTTPGAAGDSGNNGSSSTEKTEAQNRVITADAAYERMQSGDPVVIVDVRSPEEYAESHIPGAVLVPLDTIGDTMPELLPVKDAELLIYCRSGNRSAQAAAKLAKLGYTNINDFGGIKDWTYETESGEWQEKTGSLTSFRTYDLQGAPAEETVFSGKKLTMVNVWATFCGYCLQEMPDIAALADKYADRGFQVIGIVTDTVDIDGTPSQEQIEYARVLAQQTGASYRHLIPSASIMQILSDIQSVPTTFFLDEKGNLVGEPLVGARSKGEWDATIDYLLGEVGA